MGVAEFSALSSSGLCSNNRVKIHFWEYSGSGVLCSSSLLNPSSCLDLCKLMSEGQFFSYKLQKFITWTTTQNKQFKQDMLWKNVNKLASGKLFEFTCVSFSWKGLLKRGTKKNVLRVYRWMLFLQSDTFLIKPLFKVENWKDFN